MIRCSRPMSWAVASTWPSGGRRSTHWRPAASVTRKVRFEWPPAMSSKSSGRRRPPAHVRRRTRRSPRATSMPSIGGSALRPIVPAVPGLAIARPPVARWRGRRAGRRCLVPWSAWSTSPMPRSRPRSSSGPTRSRWSSTCGRRGAARAARSGPIIEQVIDETEGQVVLAKVDVDDNPAISQRLPGAGHPGGVRAQGRQGRRRLRRRPARGRRSGRSWPGCCRPRSETRWSTLLAAGRRGLAAPGARARARPRARPWSAGRAAGRRGDERRRGAGPAGPIPETAETRRVAALARAGSSTWPTTRRPPSSTRCSTG